MSLPRFVNKSVQYFRRVCSAPNTLAKLHERLQRIENDIQPTPLSSGIPYYETQVYPGYTPEDLELIERFRVPQLRPAPGFLVDFLGVHTRASSLLATARQLDGTVLPIPLPNDYHSETIEWIGLLKSVLAAKSQFVAMELGAGWGPWLISGAAAARQLGIHDVRLCGVEGDKSHFDTMRQHFLDNGQNPDDHMLHQAAAGSEDGVAWWPEVIDPCDDWGLRPIAKEGHNVADEEFETSRGKRLARKVEVKVMSLQRLLEQQPLWDLLHVDIQGGEFDVLKSARRELKSSVRYLIIGTHSRKIEGDLLEMFLNDGWELEREKPCRFKFNSSVNDLVMMTYYDGTQIWRNSAK